MGKDGLGRGLLGQGNMGGGAYWGRGRWVHGGAGAVGQGGHGALARFQGPAQPHAAFPAVGAVPPCAPVPACAPQLALGPCPCLHPGASRAMCSATRLRCPSHPAGLWQVNPTHGLCFAAPEGGGAGRDQVTPQHLHAEAAGKAALLLGCLVLLDLLVMSLSSQGTRSSGHPAGLPAAAWPSLGGEPRGAPWDARLQWVMRAWCPWASSAAPICQHPISSGAQPPCQQTTWAAMREGGTMASSRRKPFASLSGSPRGDTFPGQTLSAASHRSPAQMGTSELDNAEPSLGRAVCRARVPACTGGMLAAVGEPGAFTWRCPCRRGRWAAAPREGAAGAGSMAAPSAEGECAFQAAA